MAEVVKMADQMQQIPKPVQKKANEDLKNFLDAFNEINSRRYGVWIKDQTIAEHLEQSWSTIKSNRENKKTGKVYSAALEIAFREKGISSKIEQLYDLSSHEIDSGPKPPAKQVIRDLKLHPDKEELIRLEDTLKLNYRFQKVAYEFWESFHTLLTPSQIREDLKKPYSDAVNKVQAMRNDELQWINSMVIKGCAPTPLYMLYLDAETDFYRLLGEASTALHTRQYNTAKVFIDAINNGQVINAREYAFGFVGAEPFYLHADLANTQYGRVKSVITQLVSEGNDPSSIDWGYITSKGFNEGNAFSRIDHNRSAGSYEQEMIDSDGNKRSQTIDSIRKVISDSMKNRWEFTWNGPNGFNPIAFPELNRNENMNKEVKKIQGDTKDEAAAKFSSDVLIAHPILTNIENEINRSVEEGATQYYTDWLKGAASLQQQLEQKKISQSEYEKGMKSALDTYKTEMATLPKYAETLIKLCIEAETQLAPMIDTIVGNKEKHIRGIEKASDFLNLTINGKHQFPEDVAYQLILSEGNQREIKKYEKEIRAMLRDRVIRTGSHKETDTAAINKEVDEQFNIQNDAVITKMDEKQIEGLKQSLVISVLITALPKHGVKLQTDPSGNNYRIAVDTPYYSYFWVPIYRAKGGVEIPVTASTSDDSIKAIVQKLVTGMQFIPNGVFQRNYDQVDFNGKRGYVQVFCKISPLVYDQKLQAYAYGSNAIVPDSLFAVPYNATSPALLSMGREMGRILTPPSISQQLDVPMKFMKGSEADLEGSRKALRDARWVLFKEDKQKEYTGETWTKDTFVITLKRAPSGVLSESTFQAIPELLWQGKPMRSVYLNSQPGYYQFNCVPTSGEYFAAGFVAGKNGYFVNPPKPSDPISIPEYVAPIMRQYPTVNQSTNQTAPSLVPQAFATEVTNFSGGDPNLAAALQQQLVGTHTNVQAALNMINGGNLASPNSVSTLNSYLNNASSDFAQFIGNVRSHLTAKDGSALSAADAAAIDNWLKDPNHVMNSSVASAIENSSAYRLMQGECNISMTVEIKRFFHLFSVDAIQFDTMYLLKKIHAFPENINVEGGTLLTGWENRNIDGTVRLNTVLRNPDGSVLSSKNDFKEFKSSDKTYLAGTELKVSRVSAEDKEYLSTLGFYTSTSGAEKITSAYYVPAYRGPFYTVGVLDLIDTERPLYARVIRSLWSTASTIGAGFTMINDDLIVNVNAPVLEFSPNTWVKVVTGGRHELPFKSKLRMDLVGEQYQNADGTTREKY